MPEEKPTVIVAPHPDDETLAAGGLIATQRSRQIPVTLLAVTDGEAAYPDVPDLGRTRRVEQARAAEALGIAQDAIVRLGLRDSAVAESEAALADQIEACINSDTLLVAPWPRDPHPDHEACGRAAAPAASRTGATLISYFFWTWHRFRSGVFEWIAASPPGAIGRCMLPPCQGSCLPLLPVTSRRRAAHIAGNSSRSSTTSV